MLPAGSRCTEPGCSICRTRIQLKVRLARTCPRAFACAGYAGGCRAPLPTFQPFRDCSARTLPEPVPARSTGGDAVTRMTKLSDRASQKRKPVVYSCPPGSNRFCQRLEPSVPLIAEPINRFVTFAIFLLPVCNTSRKERSGSTILQLFSGL